MIGEHRTLGKQDVLLVKLAPMWVSFRGRYCNLIRDSSLFRSFPGGKSGKKSTCNAGDLQETQVQSLGWEDSLEKEMATHSSILAWTTPWTKKPGRLQSMRSQSRTQLSMPTVQWKTITPGAPRAKSTPFYNLSCFLLTSATPQMLRAFSPSSTNEPFPCPCTSCLYFHVPVPQS